MNELLDTVLRAHGGLDLWSGLTRITARVSIGGPIWAAKGWRDALLKETVEIDTKTERSVFSPFTQADLRSIFEVCPERVTLESANGEVIEQRFDARAAFKGFIRSTPWDRLHTEEEAVTLFTRLIDDLQAGLPSDRWIGAGKEPGLGTASIRSYTYEDQNSYAHIDIGIIAGTGPSGQNFYMVAIFGWPDNTPHDKQTE